MAAKKRDSSKKMRRGRFQRLAPGYVQYTQAGPVTVRTKDGEVREEPPLTRYQFQYQVRRCGQ